MSKIKFTDTDFLKQKSEPLTSLSFENPSFSLTNKVFMSKATIDSTFDACLVSGPLFW